MKAHLILYVADQEKSKLFYSLTFAQEPTLHVPGMTEFDINDGCILGLMPEAGIKRLLGDMIPDPHSAHGIPRAELYLRVNAPEIYQNRAIQAGAKLLSNIAPRDWGDIVGYSLDPDGHVLAFARGI